MKVIEGPKVQLSDWTGAIRQLRKADAVPRAPGHETAQEIAKRIGVELSCVRKMIQALGDRVERSFMSRESVSGKLIRIPTYRIKPKR